MFEHLTLPIILSIATLAIIDSINPVEIFAGLYLFTTKKPINLFLPYAIGIFLFHLILGFILYYSFHFILDLKILDSPIFDRSIELIGGIILIILGFKLKRHNKIQTQKILNPSPFSTLLLGISITLSALPTSAAYFSALGIIANDKLGFDSLILLLLIYNLIFVLPLFILLTIYLISQKQSQKIFTKIRNFITLHLNKILKIILIIIGSLLILDVLLYIFHSFKWFF